MAESVEYRVTAVFKSVDKMSAGLAKMGARVTAFGRIVRGTTLQTTAMYAKIGAGATAAAGVGGFGAMVMKGLTFNKVMEDSVAQVGTIFQMFNQNAAASGEVNDIAAQWSANLAMAKGSMGEMYEIAKKSPASFQQVTQLFQNAAAGLATTTNDVGRQMEFVKKAVLAGGLVGGDYQVLGSQMGRILAGSAGAEMNLWKVMQRPVLEAGKGIGAFGKKMEANVKLTEKFNQLTGETRLAIMEEALAGLGGPVAAYFGQTMEGIMSTTMSAIDTLSGGMTTQLYDGFKRFLIRANAAGGIFGPENLAKLELAAHFVGTQLSRGAEAVYGWVERSVKYFANNWNDVMARMEAMWVSAKAVAKMFIAVSAARAGIGTGLMAIGSVTGTLGTLFGGMKDFAQGAAKLGGHLLWIIPIVGVLATAFSGVIPAILGMAAYVTENWDSIWNSIKVGFETGRVTLMPLIAVADSLWGKLYAVGQVMLGGADYAGALQDAIELAAMGIQLFTNVLSAILGASSTASWALGFVITALGSVVQATGAFLEATPGFEKMGSKMKGVGDGMVTMGTKVATFSGTMEQMAQAFDRAGNRANSLSGKLAGIFGKERKGRKLGKEVEMRTRLVNGERAEDKKTPPFKPTGNVNIHTLNVHQDLRDTDPDRLLVAFIDPLKEMADKPKTSYFATKQGY